MPATLPASPPPQVRSGMSERFRVVRKPPPERTEIEQAAATLTDLTLAIGPDGELHLSVLRAGGLVQPLDWQDGTLSVEAPDADVLAVLIELAGRLDARVCDDEHLSWRSPYDHYVHPDDADAVAAAQRVRAAAVRRRQRRQWLRAGLGALFGLAVLLISHPAFWATPLTDPGSHHALPPGRHSAFTGSRPDVLLLPADDFSEAYAAHLGERLHELTGLAVKSTLAVGLGHLRPFADSLQYDAQTLVETATPAIDRLRAQYGAVPVILLTQRDINARERSTRFSFAQHYPGWRVSVVSSARLVPGTVIGRASDATIETRLLKFLLRSVGQQVYRLPRNTDIDSVMYAPVMSLSDLDRMGIKLVRPGTDTP